MDRYIPTSKTCSACVYKQEELTLCDRRYVCPECGNEMDRDLNGYKFVEVRRTGPVRSEACVVRDHCLGVWE
ncbi:zinc ribbon domain-containing protein [Fervidobacterium islandicum]|uniref:zinc ribbon domain-containing protein n=1 Tax=Fervidobacterium islandicum TaxID=2423 RepID=UPI003CF48F61